MATKTTTATTTHKAPSVTLTRHVKGWVAKIGGKVKWLAPLGKPELALQRYHQKKAAFDAGRPQPQRLGDRISLADLADQFVERKWQEHQAGNIGIRTFSEYKQAAQNFCDALGPNRRVCDIRPLDFGAYRKTLARKHKDPHTLKRVITETKSMFRWAERNQVIERAVSYGDSFNPPPAAAFRKSKKESGERLYDATQVKTMLDALKDDPIWRAIFLLSLNGGFGNTDIALLPRDALDLSAAVIDYSRPKTGADRRVTLWPETVAALREAIPLRAAPKDPADDAMVFLTARGRRLVRYSYDPATGDTASVIDRVGNEFWKRAKAVGLDRSFYDGRRTFQTIGDLLGPEHVVRYIMGHAPKRDDMGAIYRQSVAIEKLKAVTDHIRLHLRIADESNDAKVARAQAVARRRSRSPSKPARSEARQHARTAK